MKLILFTKHFRELSLEKLIEYTKYIGLEGFDLCVRQGYIVEPENIENLEKVVDIIQKEGLSVPMITLPTDFVEPESPITEKIFSSCQASKVKNIKIGYWYMGKEGYWETVKIIRGKLTKFEKLAEKYDVKVLIHNHSGGTMGLNSSSIMNLVKGFNPKFIGVFADPGHLSLVGEPLYMALDIVKDYLSAVAIKDIIRERVIEGGVRKWRIRMVPLGEGFVDWISLLKILKEIKFKGPLSIHSEYYEYDLETVMDQTRIDVRYFKKLIMQVEDEEKK